LLGHGSVDLDLVLTGDVEAARGPARRLAARLDTRAHLLGQGANRAWRIEAPEVRIELWSLGDLALEDDIARRDFSCNALVWHLPDGPLEDRIGGREDLEGGIIRALSRTNLENDPVRLVRAPRFLAQLDGFRLDPDTTCWIRSLADSVADAPRERIGQELIRLLGSPGAEAGLRALLELDLLEPAAPEAPRCDRGWTERNLTALSRLSGRAPHPLSGAVSEAGTAARLALLLRGWGLPEPDAVSAYAWPRPDRRRASRAANLLEHALRLVDASAADRRSLIHSAGAAFPVTLALAAAVDPEHPWVRWWRLWRERGEDLVDPEPLLESEEIANLLAIAPGPDLGHAIDALTEAQVRGTVRTAGGARAWLERTFQGSTHPEEG
jgi:tRNA nucleotidyltransferase (CCA-adding enzyme)